MSKKTINKTKINKILDNFIINTENIDNLDKKYCILSKKYIKIIKNRMKKDELSISNENVFTKIENDIFNLLNIKPTKYVLNEVKNIKIRKKCIIFNNKKYRCDIYHTLPSFKIPECFLLEPNDFYLQLDEYLYG